MVPLKGANRVQHILDDLLHPPAVRLVRESFLRPLDDGGDLFRQAFLLSGRHGCRAPVAEGIGIPILVLHFKRGNDLYVHIPIPDPETDVRGLGGTLFQIDGDFHLRCFFGYAAKV